MLDNFVPIYGFASIKIEQGERQWVPVQLETHWSGHKKNATKQFKKKCES